MDYAQGAPPHTLILAQSFGHSDAYQHVVEEVNTSNSEQGGTVNPLVYADLAYVEYPNGGRSSRRARLRGAGACRSTITTTTSRG